MATRSLRNNAVKRPAWQRSRLAQSVSLTVLATALSLPASAVEFNIGEIEGRFDSQLSIGSSWRMSDRNSENIAIGNGGALTSKNSGGYDDGSLNFDKHDVFSQTFKGVHDLELSYENFGAFVRGKYWYDFELEDGKQPHGNLPNGYTANSELSDDGFNSYAKFSGAEILDAYVFGEFEINNQPLDVRFGRQIVNWGESTFIQGGINSINAFDVNAFRRAGAEVKEGLLPATMAFASLGLTDNLSVEGYYQLEWEATAVDGCGTYFSTNDFGAEGCDGIRIPTLFAPPIIPAPINPSDLDYFTTYSAFAVNRAIDGHRDADDDGQFGIALRYFAEELNNTEFGFYLARYHSKLPLISGINSNAIPGAPFDAQYYISYPEDTEMLGLSFNTSLGEIAWSGEISHKKDVPLQINGPLLVGGILTQFTTGIGNTGTDTLIADAGLGNDIQGYGLFDVTQLQTTFVSFHDQVLGASRLTLIGELGWTHVHDLDESAQAIKYGRAGGFGYTAGDTEGFVTKDSFGYILRANLMYSDVFAGVNLKPEISFKHGIDGNGPEPGAVFREGEKTASISLTADYLNQYQVQVAYTNFFGGDYNALSDRDYLSLSASVSF